MSKIILILLIYLVNNQDNYEALLNEKITEEYCNEVINNIICIINDVYIYSDFHKAPIKSKYGNSYVEEVDLVKELNDVDKNNRTFYDFYRDIQIIISKARDGHLSIFTSNTQNNKDLSNYYFCLPFYFTVDEDIENNEAKNGYLTFYSKENYYYPCNSGYSKEDLEIISLLQGSKIKTINDLNPFEYIDQLPLKFGPIHSPQARYINFIQSLDMLLVEYYPFKKEELKLKIEFEDTEQTLEIEYKFEELKFESVELREFYNKK